MSKHQSSEVNQTQNEPKNPRTFTNAWPSCWIRVGCGNRFRSHTVATIIGIVLDSPLLEKVLILLSTSPHLPSRLWKRKPVELLLFPAFSRTKTVLRTNIKHVEISWWCHTVNCMLFFGRHQNLKDRYTATHFWWYHISTKYTYASCMFILQFHIRFPYCINFGTMPKTHQWTEMARRKISAPAEAPDARKSSLWLGFWTPTQSPDHQGARLLASRTMDFSRHFLTLGITFFWHVLHAVLRYHSQFLNSVPGSSWHVGIADCESENDSNHLTQRIDWECSVTSIGCAICPCRKRVQTENLLQDGKTIWKLFGVCVREPGCTVRYRWTSHSADDAESCEFVWEATGEHAAASSDEKKRNNAERFSHLTPLEATLLLCAPILYCAILFLILFFWSILDSKLTDVSTAHQSTHWILDTIAFSRLVFFGFTNILHWLW